MGATYVVQQALYFWPMTAIALTQSSDPHESECITRENGWNGPCATMSLIPNGFPAPLLSKLVAPRGNDQSFFSSFVEKRDRKSTRLNSSHVKISYAVFC